jgi:outer membrane protein assembly factor BamB
MKPLRVLCVYVVLAVPVAAAGDWPLFRGNPAQTGVAAGQPPDKLEELWQFKTGQGNDSIDSAPVIAGGVAYLAAGDQNVYAITLADGKQKWAFKAPAPFNVSPAVRDGRVYVGDRDGNFFCLDAEKGTPLWKFKCDSEISSGAGFAGDKIMFGCGDETLYCLDANGKKLWEFKVPGGPVMATPAVEKNLTFVSGCDSKLHIIDTNTGNGLAEVELGGQTGATPSLKDGTLYVGTMSAEVKAVDLKKNEVIWTFSPNRNQPFYASTAVTDKLVIAGSRDKRLYALERATGKQKWSFVTQGRIECSPVVWGERLYAGSMDGHLYVIDLDKGTEVQRVKLDSAVTGSIAVADGKLLVGTQNGTLYCFGKK